MPKRQKIGIQISPREMTPDEQQRFKTAVMIWLKELVDRNIEKRRSNGNRNITRETVRGSDPVQ
jgi:hypothetical protein